MCEAGRIRHHLKNELETAKNTVLLVGYMAENTLGRRLLEEGVKEVKIFDQMYEKKAEVIYINAYSGHADMQDLDRYIASIAGLKKVVVVHGEIGQAQPFSDRIRAAMKNVEVTIPAQEESVLL